MLGESSYIMHESQHRDKKKMVLKIINIHKTLH